MVGLGGLEPPTSPLSGARSSHLSYRPFQLWQQLFLLYRTPQILAILVLPAIVLHLAAGILVGEVSVRDCPADDPRCSLNLHPPCVSRKASFVQIVCFH